MQARTCSTNQARHKYKRGYTVQIKYIIGTSEDVQYDQGTSYFKYQRGRVVQSRHIFSKSQDVQYESGTSSVLARMCNTSK